VVKVLRLPEVLAATGVSRMTIYRLEAKGQFPRRRRLGANSVGWLEEEVSAWIQGRPIAEPGADLMVKFTSLPRG
jgi:prophage regulatory protein